MGNVEWLYQGPTKADAAAQAVIVRSFIQQKVETFIVARTTRFHGPAAAAGEGRRHPCPTAGTDAPSSVREAFVNQASADGIGEGFTDALMTAMGGKGSTPSCPAGRPRRT